MNVEHGATVAVFGATGTQGGAVARHLAGMGYRVLALGRNENALVSMAVDGCEPRRIPDLTFDTLTTALRGAQAAFVTVPYAAGARDVPLEETAREIALAMADAGVKRAGWTTSWLATTRGRTVSKTFDDLRAFVDIALSSRIPSAVLKPAGYLDNFLAKGTAEAIAGGKLPYMLPADFRYRWVSCSDQARVVARILATDEFPYGEFDLGTASTGLELAEAASRALGRRVDWQPVTPRDFADRWRPTLGGAADQIANDYLCIAEHHEDLGPARPGRPIARTVDMEYTRTEEFFREHTDRFTLSERPQAVTATDGFDQSR